MGDMNPLQQADLDMVKEVTAICERHGFTYYINGGTMLGAVRHKGFIPWDDDIDLCMPREDYESFLSVAASEISPHLKVVNYRTDPKYHYYITRILDTDTKVVEERIGNEDRYTHASIDIFPVDGTPNNGFLRKIYFFRILYHRALMSLCYKDSIDRKRPRNPAEKVFLRIMERIPVEKLTTPYRQKAIVDRLLRRHKVKGSRYIGTIMGAYRTREIVPAEYYGKGKMYPFEDTELRGMEMADAYLRHYYGDYMRLPPESERKTHFRVIEIHGKKAENQP